MQFSQLSHLLQMSKKALNKWLRKNIGLSDLTIMASLGNIKWCQNELEPMDNSKTLLAIGNGAK